MEIARGRTRTTPSNDGRMLRIMANHTVIVAAAMSFSDLACCVSNLSRRADVCPWIEGQWHPALTFAVLADMPKSLRRGSVTTFLDCLTEHVRRVDRLNQALAGKKVEDRKGLPQRRNLHP